MLALWRLKLSKTWTTLKFQSRYKRARKKGKGEDAMHELAERENFELNIIESQIDVLLSDALLAEGRELDLEVPRYPAKVWEDEKWQQDAYSDGPYLSPKGRFGLRRLIDEEKERRFNVKTLWVTKIILPVASLVLATLVGLIGAITGLIAVLHHSK